MQTGTNITARKTAGAMAENAFEDKPALNTAESGCLIVLAIARSAPLTNP
jgi:hypothetical protein